MWTASEGHGQHRRVAGREVLKVGWSGGSYAPATAVSTLLFKEPARRDQQARLLRRASSALLTAGLVTAVTANQVTTAARRASSKPPMDVFPHAGEGRVHQLARHVGGDGLPCLSTMLCAVSGGCMLTSEGYSSACGLTPIWISRRDTGSGQASSRLRDRAARQQWQRQEQSASAGSTWRRRLRRRRRLTTVGVRRLAASS